ncbi:MAG: hypothetical protein WBC07_08520 [Methylotenera sp.]
MALSTQSAAALVGGGIQAKVKTMKVKVLRPFLIGGKVQAEGKKIEVPFALGIELIGGNKVEKLADEAKEPKEPKAGDE